MGLDPVSLTVAATAIGAAGSLVEGFAGYQAGQYRSQVARFNEKMARDNAARSIYRSQVEQQTQDTMTATVVGTQTARQGASGLSVTGKSQVQTRRQAQELGRLDALNVRQAGEVESYNYRQDAANFRSEAAAAQNEANFAMLAGGLNAASSLIGGAQSVQALGGGKAGTATQTMTLRQYRLAR